MGIRVFLHPNMWYLTGGGEAAETTGATVGECLEQLIAQYPGLETLVFYKDGTLQTFIEIYVNQRAAYPNELEWPVTDGDEIHLMMMISGG